jgi:hypothetical protein
MGILQGNVRITQHAASHSLGRRHFITVRPRLGGPLVKRPGRLQTRRKCCVSLNFASSRRSPAGAGACWVDYRMFFFVSFLFMVITAVPFLTGGNAAWL